MADASDVQLSVPGETDALKGGEGKNITVNSQMWAAHLTVLIDFLGSILPQTILVFLVYQVGYGDAECPQYCDNPPPSTPNSTFVNMCGVTPGCGTDNDLGYVNGIYSVGQIVGSIVMGKLSDKMGRRPVNILSFLGSAASFAWVAFSPTLLQLYISRFVAGCFAGTMPVVQAMIMDITPNEGRGQQFGFIGASVGLSFVLGPVAGAGIQGFAGVRWAMFCPTILAVLGAILAFFKIPETKIGGGCMGDQSPEVKILCERMNVEKPSDGPVDLLGGHEKKEEEGLPPIVWLFFLAMMLNSMILMDFATIAIPVLWLLFGLDVLTVGIFLSGLGILTMFANIVLVPLFVLKFGPWLTIIFNCIVSTVAICFFDAMPNVYLYLGVWGLFVKVFGFDFHMPVLSVISSQICPPAFRGTAAGLIAAGMSLGLAIGPFVAGALVNIDFMYKGGLGEAGNKGYSPASFYLMGIVGAVELVILIAAWLMARKMEPPQEEEEASGSAGVMVKNKRASMNLQFPETENMTTTETVVQRMATMYSTMAVHQNH